MGVRLILLRHGETLWNREHRVQGQLDVALAEEGIRQARRAAEAFRRIDVQAVYSSDLSRAMETARIIFPKAHIHPDVRLRETYLGDWQGRIVSEVNAAPHGGESHGDVEKRVASFADEIKDYDGTVLAVTHGNAARILVAHCLGIEEESLRKLTNTAWGVLNYNHPRWTLAEWNVRAWL